MLFQDLLQGLLYGNEKLINSWISMQKVCTVHLCLGRNVLTHLFTTEGLFVKRMEILDKLNKREWLNNPTPKPLKISFPSSNEVRMIGRRRKLTEEEKIRHEERMEARKQSVGS